MQADNIRKSKKPASATRFKIPRPINCFMAFRLDKYTQISSKSAGLNHRDISRIIAKWWKEATDEEKEPYRIIAAKAKLEHEKLYPDYKYTPIKKSQRKTRPYNRKEDLETRLRKRKAKEEIMRQWLGEDVTPVSSHIDYATTGYTDVNTVSYEDHHYEHHEYVQHPSPSTSSVSSYSAISPASFSSCCSLSTSSPTFKVEETYQCAMATDEQLYSSLCEPLYDIKHEQPLITVSVPQHFAYNTMQQTQPLFDSMALYSDMFLPRCGPEFIDPQLLATNACYNF